MEAETIFIGSDRPLLPSSATPDGKHILITALGGPNLSDIFAISATDSTVWEPILATPAEEYQAVTSPDGGFIAYSSDETGREEIFVRKWPVTGARWQVSTDGGRGAVWAEDGRTLYFSEDGDVYATPVSTEGGVFRSGTPRKLFSLRLDMSGVPQASFVVLPGGQRFLAVTTGTEGLTTHTVLRKHWARQLGDS